MTAALPPPADPGAQTSPSRTGALSPSMQLGLALLCGTALIGGVLLWARRRRPPRSDSSDVAEAAPPKARRAQVAFGASLIAGVLAAGGVTYYLGMRLIERSTVERLQTVATLKEALIQAWIEEGRDGFRAWSVSPYLARLLQNWLADPGARGGEPGRELADHLSRLRIALDYSALIVRDATTGQALYATSEGLDSSAAQARAVAAATEPSRADSQPWMVHDRHPAMQDGTFESDRLDYFAVVQVGAKRLVLEAETDISKDLMRLISTWPGNARTAELLLGRLIGDRFEILDSGTGDSSTKTVRRIGTTEIGSFGQAIALARQGGVARGRDDLGHPSIAYAVPVAGTPWMLVAKLDETEVFGELHRIVGVAAIMAAVLALIATLWARERAIHDATTRRLQLERTRQANRLLELSRHVVTVQEEDSRRFAAELHDRTAANLAAIQLNLKAIERSVPVESDDDRALLKETGHLIADTVGSIRDLCTELRPAILDSAGLAGALVESVTQLRRRTGTEASFEEHGDLGRLDPDVESALFRIAQEALLNCAKHARAGRVVVRLSIAEGSLRMDIEDDGVGLDPALLAQFARGNSVAGGHGMRNMRERAALVGGDLIIESRAAEGTAIRVVVPRASPRGSGSTDPPPGWPGRGVTGQ